MCRRRPGLHLFELNFVDPQKRRFNRVGTFYQCGEKWGVSKPHNGMFDVTGFSSQRLYD
jgi:hypothetical protein